MELSKMDQSQSSAMHTLPSSVPAISVVIPYFQRQVGILSKAVRSILAQQLCPAEIIVVDDGSPVPARVELAALLAAHPQLSLRIVEQVNGGPARARNKGLDMVSPGTEYVAFLDSDDVWHDTHLLHAANALDAGHDFYFADYFRLDQQKSVFELATAFKLGAHPVLEGELPVARYVGNMMEQILGANVIGTSTVVYRYRRFAALRFREEFVNAGEDVLFWLELSTRTDKFAFGLTPEVTYGRGVNIFAGSGWGTEQSMLRLHYETKLAHAIPKLYTLSGVQQERIRSSKRHLRYTMLKDLIHRLGHRKTIDLALLRRHVQVDPWFPLLLPSMLVSLLMKRMTGSRS
jgi:succinoglycan biosynthesis protein ExoW